MLEAFQRVRGGARAATVFRLFFDVLLGKNKILILMKTTQKISKKSAT